MRTEGFAEFGWNRRVCIVCTVHTGDGVEIHSRMALKEVGLVVWVQVIDNR